MLRQIALDLESGAGGIFKKWQAVRIPDVITQGEHGQRFRGGEGRRGKRAATVHHKRLPLVVEFNSDFRLPEQFQIAGHGG